MNEYTVTGNDYITLPKIKRGDIESITFLSSAYKGLLELQGGHKPWLAPVLKLEKKAPMAMTTEGKLGHWIPTFLHESEGIRLTQTVLAPIDGRGFVVRLECVNTTDKPQAVSFGVEGEWKYTHREINATDELSMEKTLHYGWFDTPVFSLVSGVPVFSFAFLFDKKTDNRVYCNGKIAQYSFLHKTVLLAGESTTLDCAFGIGYDSVASITSALDMQRHTFPKLLEETLLFLSRRTIQTGNPLVDKRLNENLFFCYFCSAGRTLDTEKFVCVTSRSPRYYVSSAYWDRDSLLWAFPAVLEVDEARAKEVLDYAFQTQIRNVGVLSRYIDGCVLEPGFELDCLCAPIIALCNYYEKTRDEGYLASKPVVDGVRKILEILRTKRHKTVSLFETFLYPSDDMHRYPYLTYDNALVAYALQKTATMYEDILEKPLLNWCKQTSLDTYTALGKHCMADKERVYAWCVDLQGNYELYDEPAGSLILLPCLGACDSADELYQNTVKRLYSKKNAYSFSGRPYSQLGCAHSPHPWILSYVNAVLSNHAGEETLREMLAMKMDNGLACESISEITGESETGEAFATCAGFYAYALMRQYGANTKKSE